MREAALCLKNMAVNDENSVLIGKFKGVEHLLQLINSNKSDTLRKVAAITIQTLAKNSENMKIIEVLKTRSTEFQQRGDSNR